MSPRRPTGESEGKAGRDMGLEPQSGFWDSIHEFRSSISWSSERSFCLREHFDLGFLIAAGSGCVETLDFGEGRILGLGF